MVSLAHCSAAALGLPIISALISLSKCLMIMPLLFRWAFPLSQIPGPASARFSRLWLWRALSSGKADRIFVKIEKQYGSLVRIGPNHLLTSDPLTTRRILSPASGYTRGPWFDSLSTDFAEGNLVSERDPQNESRLRKIFHTALLRYGNDKIETVINANIVSWIQGLERGSSVVDMAESVSFLAVDVASHITLGEALGCVKSNKDKHGFIAMIRNNMAAQQFLSLFLEAWRLLRLLSTTTLRSWIVPSADDGSDIGQVLGVAKKVMATEYGNLDKTQHSLIGWCIQGGIPVDTADMHSLVLLSAGAENLATTVQGTILAIISNPHVYHTLQDEVDIALSRNHIGFPIEYRQAKELPYLQACIKEGLRLFQPLFQLRERVVPPEGDFVQGYYVPGGTFIGLNAMATQLNSVFGDDPESFRPERWFQYDDVRTKKMLQTLDLVFGSGPSRCMGANIALMEKSKVIFELLRNFDISVKNPQRPWKKTSQGITYIEEFYTNITRRDTVDTAFRWKEDSM